MHDTQAHKDPELLELDEKDVESAPIDGDIVEAFTPPEEDPEDDGVIDDEEEVAEAADDGESAWNAI